MNWKAKPVRALSGNVWLRTAEQKYSGTFLTWNGTSVLVKWINPRHAKSQVIVAGQAPKKPVPFELNNPQDSGNGSVPDPWATHRANHGNHFATPGPGGNASVATASTRKVDAPLETRFKQQDDVFQQLKTQTQEEITKLKGDITELKSTMTKTQQGMETVQKNTQSEFAAIRKETAVQFTTMQNTFQSSLTSSLQQHERHVSGQFEELKKLLQNSNRSGRKAQKTARETAMEEDEASSGL